MLQVAEEVMGLSDMLTLPSDSFLSHISCPLASTGVTDRAGGKFLQ